MSHDGGILRIRSKEVPPATSERAWEGAPRNGHAGVAVTFELKIRRDVDAQLGVNSPPAFRHGDTLYRNSLENKR
jgi:hypothetical protein